MVVGISLVTLFCDTIQIVRCQIERGPGTVPTSRHQLPLLFFSLCGRDFCLAGRSGTVTVAIRLPFFPCFSSAGRKFMLKGKWAAVHASHIMLAPSGFRDTRGGRIVGKVLTGVREVLVTHE